MHYMGLVLNQLPRTQAITTPTSGADCPAVNASYVNIEPDITKAFELYVGQVPAFLNITEGIEIKSIIDADISGLNSSNVVLGQAVITLCIVRELSVRMLNLMLI